MELRKLFDRRVCVVLKKMFTLRATLESNTPFKWLAVKGSPLDQSQ